ncbi:MAG: hypothetical protein EOP45_18990, partial [Sphingobacteriaceae bacterium]
MNIKTVYKKKAAIVMLSILSISSIVGCKKDNPPAVVKPPVTSVDTSIVFKLEAAKNTGKVDGDVTLTIEGNTAKGYTPGFKENHKFVLSFIKNAKATIKIGDVLQVSGVTENDFAKPIVYTVTDAAGVSKNYTVSIFNFTGLPILNLTTAGPVNSKDNYVTGNLNVNTNGLFEQETNN